jgi:hypothetical protein
MKKHILTSILSFVGTLFFAQVPLANMSFETWDNEHITPEGWSVENQCAGEVCYPFASQTAIGVKSGNGSYYAILQNQTVDNSVYPATIKKNERINALPKTVTGWYKYLTQIDDNDSAYISVAAFKANSFEPSAYGSKTLSPSTSWKKFSIDIELGSNTMLDSITIAIGLEDQLDGVTFGLGNRLMIDNIEVLTEILTGTEEENNMESTTFLQADGTINFSEAVAHCELMDLTGKVVVRAYKTQKIDLYALQSGMYIVHYTSKGIVFSDKIYINK